MMTNGKPYILVVEDDAPVRNLITTTLESQNYKYMLLPMGIRQSCPRHLEARTYSDGSGTSGYGRRGRDQEDTHLVRGSDYRDQRP